MAKNQEISWARDDYREIREIRAMLGGAMTDAFEAIVCRNEVMGPTAAGAFPQVGRSAAEDRLRITVKFCADKVHERYSGLMRWLDAPEVKALPVAKPATPLAKPTAPVSIVDEIVAAIALKADRATALWVSSEVLTLLKRAVSGAPVQTLETFAGLPVVEHPNWRWGYVVVG